MKEMHERRSAFQVKYLINNVFILSDNSNYVVYFDAKDGNRSVDSAAWQLRQPWE